MRGALIVLALTLVVAGCGGESVASKSASVRTAGSAPAPDGLPSGSRLLLDAAEPVSSAYAGAGSLYFSYTSPVGEHVGEDDEMLRVDSATGGIAAQRHFASPPAAVTLAGGSLWVTTSSSHRVTLWRLSPASLAVRSTHRLPSSPRNDGIAGSMAVAGAQLWVGTGLIDGVSLRTGRVDRVVAPSHPGPVQLQADSTGRVLLASEGYRRPTYIVRLNPETGRARSELTVPNSDSQPSLGGIDGGGAWIENVAGTNTKVWRIGLSTMKTTSAWPAPAGRISVRLIDGVLWVTEPVGQDNLNYCADPATGRALSRLPLLPGNSVFLTADRTSVFYTDVPINAHKVKLERAPISRRCAA